MRLQGSPGYRTRDGAYAAASRSDVRPIVILNPRSDARFVELVNQLMADAIGEPAELQSGLRAEFPEAVVRRRELSSEPTEVWYVYRDGHWTPD